MISAPVVPQVPGNVPAAPVESAPTVH